MELDLKPIELPGIEKKRPMNRKRFVAAVSSSGGGQETVSRLACAS